MHPRLRRQARGRWRSESTVQFNGTVPASTAADALFNLLVPFWQLVLGGVVVVFLVGATARLVRRGPSRMNTAILVTGAGVVGLVLLGVLFARAEPARPANPDTPSGSSRPASR